MRPFLPMCAALSACASTRADGAVSMEFSGGSGSVLTVTTPQGILFTVTEAGFYQSLSFVIRVAGSLVCSGQARELSMLREDASQRC
jgi:hypothetical protein